MMKSTFTCVFFGLSLLLFAIHVIPTESSGGKISIERISPNVTYVVQGESLMLNVPLDARNNSVIAVWKFRPHLSTTPFRVFQVKLSQGQYTGHVFGDHRFSLFSGISLRLVNTTLNDSGEYVCVVNTTSLKVLSLQSFNVTIEGKPKAETNCSKKVELIEGDDFSCLCEARGVNLVPTASWMNNGDPKLSLINVSKEDAGTYVCRAKLHSLVGTTSTKVVIHYRPRINYFQCSTSKNVMTFACVADGLPKPAYTITGFSGTELPGVVNGVVTIRNHRSNVKTLYRCIANNTLGRDEQSLDLSLERCLSHLAAKTPPKQGSWFFREIELYIALICAVVGVVFGFALSCGCQRLRRRKARANLHKPRRANTPVYDEPIAMATSPTSPTSPTYQELNMARPDEENHYQNLLPSAQSSGQV